MSVTVSREAIGGSEVTYARLREGRVARTVEVSGSVNVDVDEHDLVLGVETLGGEDWPDALVTLAMEGRLAVPKRPDQVTC